jgi:hypothetical protein
MRFHRRTWAVLAAAATAVATFGARSAVAGSSEAGPTVTTAPITRNEEQRMLDMRREGLTKLLSGMEYTGAPEERMARIREELEALGGPDPSVEPVDGPDNPAEWALQADAYEHMCQEGDQDACEALPEARERAGIDSSAS